MKCSLLISAGFHCCESDLPQVSKADVQSSQTHLHHSGSQDGGGKKFKVLIQKPEGFRSLPQYFFAH